MITAEEKQIEAEAEESDQRWRKQIEELSHGEKVFFLIVARLHEAVERTGDSPEKCLDSMFPMLQLAGDSNCN